MLLVLFLCGDYDAYPCSFRRRLGPWECSEAVERGGATMSNVKGSVQWGVLAIKGWGRCESYAFPLLRVH